MVEAVIRTWCFGGEGWLDSSGQSEDHGSGDAGLLPANHGTVPDIVNLELSALHAGYFGAWFGGPTDPQ
jgi:hypothetical protein